MSQATTYSTAQYGLDEETSLGIFANSCSFNSTSSTAEALNHNGCVVGTAIYDFRMEVTLDGVVIAKGTRPGGSEVIGDTITFANMDHNRDRTLDFTATGGITILTGGSTNPTATGFEAGSLTAMYLPYCSE